MASNLLVIDSCVKDYHHFLSEELSEKEYLILDSSLDGLLQLTDFLNRKEARYDSIQFISHGSPGSIAIGSTVLDNGTLTAYADQLDAIGRSLTENGDLLLYGCNIANGKEGIQFIETLAEMSGADVAASDDLTGGSAVGGDWLLEVKRGEVENSLLVSEPAIQNYEYTLGYSDDYLLAKMSLVAYYDNPENPDEDDSLTYEIAKQSWEELYADGWQIMVRNSEGEYVVAVDYCPVNPTETHISFAATVFRKGDTIVIAYRGTEKTDPGDIKADLAIANPYPDWDLQFSDALSLAERIKEQNSGANILVTGHSLGGSLAQVASQMYGFSGAAFDAGAAGNVVLSSEFMLKSIVAGQGLLGKGTPDSFTNYLIFGSAVSGLSGLHLGGIEPLYAPEGIVHQLSLHSMAGILELMRGKTLEAGVAIYGTMHNDLLASNALDNVVYGYEGNDAIAGFGGNDTIYGGEGNDSIFAQDGNDVIEADSGDDRIDGGLDSDIVVFSGYFADYFITYDASTLRYAVQDTVAGRDGTDVISNVENFQFADGTTTAANSMMLYPFPVGKGYVITDFGRSDYANSIVVQPDGKILVAGQAEVLQSNGWEWQTDFAIVRYNSDGTLDTSLSFDGKVTTDIAYWDYGSDIVVQLDGRIIVVGESSQKYSAVRYTAEGYLDYSFSGDGRVTADFSGSYVDDGYSAALQHDGKIVVGGTSGVVRYNIDGSLDTSFSGDGMVSPGFYSWGGSYDSCGSVVVQPDGKIVLSGYTFNSSFDFAVIRYNIDGSVDTSFGNNGKVATDFDGRGDYGRSMALQSDGKILVTGFSQSGSDGRVAIARYNTDGRLDLTFSGDGKQIISYGVAFDGYGITIQPDGKILVAGTVYYNNQYDFALVRLNQDGSLDSGFSFDGCVAFDFGGNSYHNWDKGSSVALQSDGKILVAGYTFNGNFQDIALVRFNQDGSLDRTFGIENTYVNDAPIGSVTISGTPIIGHTLTASHTLSDTDGLDVISYQWYSDYNEIDGATGCTYTLTESDIGQTVFVVVNYLDGNGTDESVRSLSTVPVIMTQSGVAQDGYLANALVWVDANDNGRRDWTDANGNGSWDAGEGESWTLSDTNGRFAGLIGAGTLRITANPSGGTIDLSTGKPFTGSFSAPSGSAIINPITTLIEISGGNADMVKTALGLDAGFDLTIYDPLVSLATSGTDTESVVQAMKVQSTALQIANLIDIAESVIYADSGGASADGMTDTAICIVSALVAAIASNPSESIDLTDSALLMNAITVAAQIVVTDEAARTIINQHAGVIADAIALVNRAIEEVSESAGDTAQTGAPIDVPGSLSRMVAAQIVAHDTVAEQASVVILANDSSLMTVTSENIDQSINGAASEVGQILPMRCNGMSVMSDRYTGPATAAGGEPIHFQYLGDSTGEVLIGTAYNDFINVGDGVDAVDAGDGNDVIDGGTGSNFLSGGAGTDIFFSDGRGGQTTWSTIVDWQSGEQLSVWGWQPGVSRILLWVQAGAPGYEGLTMHADLNGDNVIDTSVTFTGIASQSQLPTPLEFDGVLWFV